MAAPDEAGASQNFGRLYERMDGVREDVQRLTNEVTRLGEAIQKLDVARAAQDERQSGRATANESAIEDAGSLIEHKDQSSISRDKEQLMQLREEEVRRIGGDKNNVALIEKLIAKVDGLFTVVSEIKSNDRIVARVGSVIIVIITGYITGHLLRVFP